MGTLNRSRRIFLKSACVSIALPTLESRGKQSERPQPVRRTVVVGNSFGMYQPSFFPEQSGANYEMTPLLKPLERHRKDFTVFSNLDHGIKGGHFAVHSFLSGVRRKDAKAMPNGNITLDQRAAEMIGHQSRFPSITVGSTDGLHGGCAMCWTRTGVRVPPIQGPKELFRKLFIEDDAPGKAKLNDRFQLETSILDMVKDEADSLGRRVSKRDKTKLDEYFSSIRDVERRIQQQQQWQGIAKPEAPIKEPRNENLVDDIPELYELLALALETDSTRIATLELAGTNFSTGKLGLKKGYHALSHHGQVKENIEGLVKLETYQMSQFATFLDRLKAIETPDGGGSLFDQTAVLFGSGMGNANSHTNNDLPIILAGGGYKLGEHRIMPQQSNRRVPLCNLFLSLLQRLGIEDDSFGLSTGTFNGLELQG